MNEVTPDNAARATPVVRYEMDVGSSSWRTYVDYSESADGEWVKYIDHAATVAALEAEVEAWRSQCDGLNESRKEEANRADAAERRVVELRHALVEVTASLAWLAHGECRSIHDGPIMPSDKAVQFSRATITGADPT